MKITRSFIEGNRYQFDFYRLPRETNMYTYQDYLDQKCTHPEYYGQFVNPAIISVVKRQIGVDRILASPDPYFNDIPMKEWEDMAQCFTFDFAKYHDSPSLAGKICILKQAARTYWRSQQEGTYMVFVVHPRFVEFRVALPTPIIGCHPYVGDYCPVIKGLIKNFRCESYEILNP